MFLLPICHNKQQKAVAELSLPSSRFALTTEPNWHQQEQRHRIENAAQKHFCRGDSAAWQLIQTHHPPNHSCKANQKITMPLYPRLYITTNRHPFVTTTHPISLCRLTNPWLLTFMVIYWSADQSFCRWGISIILKNDDGQRFRRVFGRLNNVNYRLESILIKLVWLLLQLMMKSRCR